MIGRAISHYRVISTLGSGGMGVVYLAEDERLGRHVALKFLPTESTTDRQALDRFRVEARAASSLSHPGICAIYDIGEDAGTPYIVMEVLKGESLRDRINRGPLKVTDVLDIGIQLADALDAAHQQGIIHRDIKPSNIFVGEKNRTKILDFGLAKLAQTGAGMNGVSTRLDASTRRDLTMPGSALGTVSYMSPEQARGEDVDTRTDLFSLGVVLYEMATGIQAFTGGTQAVIFDAILNRTPQHVSHINPLIPPRLDALIATALEKDRDLRHQHASDLEAELKRIRRDLESGTQVSASSAGRAAAVPSSTRTPTTAAGVPQTSQQRRTWMYGAAVALIVIAVAAFMLWPETSPTDTSDSIATTAGTPTEISRPQAAPTDTPAPATPPAETPAPAPTTPPVSGRATQPPPDKAAGAGSRGPVPQPVPAPPNRGDAPPIVPAPSPQAAPPLALPPPPQQAETKPEPAKTDAPKPETKPEPPPPAPEKPAATGVVDPPVTQPPPRASTESPSSGIPLKSPVESDDAAIRNVVRTYERAIETKSVELFRSVRPGLSAAEETRLRDSFRQVDSQQMDVVIEELRIDGRAATVRLSRRDTFVSAGRRQTANSQQTLRLAKTSSGWIITDILGR